MREKLTVIGNGMVGMRFLEELISHNPYGFDITVLGEEPDPAYNRILLSSLLAGHAGREDLPLKSRRWYRKNAIDLRTGCKAELINPWNRTVYLESGEKQEYDKLVIATGSAPIRLPLPGSDLPQVRSFRHMQDVEYFQKQIAAGKSVVVVGGGLLGLETAYGLKNLGADVTLVHLMDRLMERQLDDEAGALLKRQIEVQGIRVLLNAETERFEGSDKLESVRLKDGRRLACDFAVMAVGIKPEISVTSNSGIKCNRGIKVDDHLETSQPDIYAIGECAEHNGMVYGLVEPLYEQARVLAAHLNGNQDASFSGSTLSTNLKVSGIEVFSAGESRTLDSCQCLYFRDENANIYKKLQVACDEFGDEILVGAVLVGERTDGPWFAQLIENRTPVGDIRDTLIFGRDISELAA